MASTIERVKKVAAELLDIDPSTIQDNARFIEDLGVKSVQTVELIAGFEEEFEIEMEEDDALAAKSVSKAAELIDACL